MTDTPHNDGRPTEEEPSSTIREERGPGGGGGDLPPAASGVAQPESVDVRLAPAIFDGDGRGCSVELPNFEGPLDLLLHLVRRHELDILDIPIAFVCEKYLEYLGVMQALDLEIAGDYLVMAATLAYLKSRELLPPDPANLDEVGEEREDGPDPRHELIERLLEYQKYRAAADDLDRLPISGRDVFSRGAVIELPPFDPGLSPITLYRLAEAYHRVLERARIHKSHEVVLEVVTVSARMRQLALLLRDQSAVEFEALFLDRTWSSEAELRTMLIVTLMSVLELTKLGIIRVHQQNDSETMVLERRARPEDADEVLAGYDEGSSFGIDLLDRDESDAEGDTTARDDATDAPKREQGSDEQS